MTYRITLSKPVGVPLQRNSPLLERHDNLNPTTGLMVTGCKMDGWNKSNIGCVLR